MKKLLLALCALIMTATAASAQQAPYVRTVPTLSTQVTYCASTAYFTPAATPTDVFVIEGSATKTIAILSVELAGVQNTAGVNQWFLNKHSAANSGGTPVASAKIPVDSTFVAATALVQHYTANPTPGASLGSVATNSILSPAAGSVANGTYNLYTAGVYDQPITLRGTAQGLALNFAGAALPAGLTISVRVRWIEY